MTVIELPWPHASLFPNAKARSHWSAHRKPAKMSRTLAWGLTAQALGPKLRSFEIPGKKLEMRVEITPPQRPGRVPDEDGVMGACKHYFDGIADALGVNDSRFAYPQPEWRPKDGAGSIVISF